MRLVDGGVEDMGKRYCRERDRRVCEKEESRFLSKLATLVPTVIFPWRRGAVSALCSLRWYSNLVSKQSSGLGCSFLARWVVSDSPSGFLLIVSCTLEI